LASGHFLNYIFASANVIAGLNTMEMI